MSGHEAGQRPLHLPLVQPLADRGDLQHRLPQQRRVALLQRGQQVGDRGTLQGVQPPGGAEVQQPSRPSASTQTLAGWGSRCKRSPLSICRSTWAWGREGLGPATDRPKGREDAYRVGRGAIWCFQAASAGSRWPTVGTYALLFLGNDA